MKEIKYKSEENRLHELGEKIFLDRYSLKDMERNSFEVGDIVLIQTDTERSNREVGNIIEIYEDNFVKYAKVKIGNDVFEKRIIEIDKPLETPEEVMDRMAKGAASVEKEEVRESWENEFRWALDGYKFVPAGRIWAMCGTKQKLTAYNCYVLPSPKDSREGILQTAIDWVNIQSRGGGTGINISTLRPKNSFVKGVNGRSSGSVHWAELYSFLTNTVSQGGCLTSDSLIFTEFGPKYIKELVKHEHEGWENANFSIIRDELKYNVNSVVNNGIKDVYEVEFENGIKIKCTDIHPFLIQESDGEKFKELKHLKIGDWGTFGLKNIIDHDNDVNLIAPNKQNFHFNTNTNIKVPEIITNDLAFLIGLFIGDGYSSTGYRVGFAVNNDSYLIEELPKILERVFPGCNVLINEGSGDCSLIYVSSALIYEYFKVNGLLKNCSLDACIPSKIWQLNHEKLGHFIAGLLEADGSLCHGYPLLSTASEKLSQEFSYLLMGLGIPVNINVISKEVREDNESFGKNPLYRIKPISSLGYNLMYEKIKFHKDSRLNKSFNIDLGREKNNAHPFPKRILDGIHKYGIGQIRRDVSRYIRNERKFSYSSATLLSDKYDECKGLEHTFTWRTYSKIKSIKYVGKEQTYDLSVNIIESYVANGVIVHNSRRGAALICLNDWHPDIEEFVELKKDMSKMKYANISVCISNKFIDAVKQDEDWVLKFPDTNSIKYDLDWNGDIKDWENSGNDVVKYKIVKARDLWDKIVYSAWASAEPGLIFIDRMNDFSNSKYYESGKLISCNPCGEIGLPGWGICNLGHINLSKFYNEEKNDIDWNELGKICKAAARFQDNIIDYTPYFHEENKKQQKMERRVGIGTLGLAELLVKLKVRYGSDESVKIIEEIYSFITYNLYWFSSENSKEKGCFPLFDKDKFFDSDFMKNICAKYGDLKSKIQNDGIRNVVLNTAAPTGSVGTMINTSTGIEPFYAWEWKRVGRLGEHIERVKIYDDFIKENKNVEIPNYFVTSMELEPKEHIAVQAACQKWIDQNISKTINCPSNWTVDQVAELYMHLYDSGCKGGTIYRDKSRNEQVLHLIEEKEEKEQEVNHFVDQELGYELANQLCYETYADNIRYGDTTSIDSPAGTCHVTVNYDNNDFEHEVFIQIGKAGSEILAWSEALGRMISYILQIPSPIMPEQKMDYIIEQLEGIGGSNPTGFGKNRTCSVPDAIAKGLKRIANKYENDEQEGGLEGFENDNDTDLPENHSNASKTPPKPSQADLCPGCGGLSLRKEQGCKSCAACGFSMC